MRDKLITVVCEECKSEFGTKVHEGDWGRWKSSGLIREEMPYLTEFEIDLLETNVCGDCMMNEAESY